MVGSAGNPEAGYTNEYREFPDDDGVRRCTTARLVFVSAPKEKIQTVIEKELHGAPFPSIYMLVDEEAGAVYVGESGNTAKRIKQHTQSPPRELAEWNQAILIWDGRPIDLSSFNETSLREKLEYEVIDALRFSDRLVPVNKVVSSPTLSHLQEIIAGRVLTELLYLLVKRDFVTPRVLETKKQRELGVDEHLIPLLEDRGYTLSDVDRGKKVLKLDDQQVFYRPGTEKPRGWQVTIRGAFKDFVEGKEDGFLIINRGSGYLVPVQTLRGAFLELMERQHTLDIFVSMEGDSTSIVAHNVEVDISGFSLESEG